MRIVRVQVSDLWLILSMTQGKEYHYKCIKGLPEDVKFVRMHSENTFDFTLIYEHESFKELKLSEEIPIFKVEFERLER